MTTAKRIEAVQRGWHYRRLLGHEGLGHARFLTILRVHP